MSEDVDLFGAPMQAPKKPWYSPTRLKTFLDCPRKYEFSVVRKLPTAASKHLDFGNNVHAALRDWLRMSPKLRTKDNLVQFFRSAWRDNSKAFERSPREEVREWGERGKAMLLRYADVVPPNLEPVLIERLVSADYGDVVVGGKVDRVDALPDGSLKVIDYKTGKFPKSPARFREEDLAAPVYARATSLAFAGAPVVEVELQYLESGESLVFTIDEMWQAHKDLAVVSAAHATHEAEKSNTFEPRPSPLCDWCDFKQRCPEGKAFLDALPRPR
jgi:RecB family exonuclease